MAYPAHTATAILGNLFSAPATAVTTLGAGEAFAALLVLTAAVAGLIAIRNVSRAPVPAAGFEYREAA